jgi:tetratricopeptide (TPR) repeat protein
MGKDLVITSINNDHARKVIARLICQKQSIPLQKALTITAKPPFVFVINESDELIKKVVGQYSQLGITFKIVDSSQQSSTDSSHELVHPDKVQISNTVALPQKAEHQKINHTVHHLPSDDPPVVSDKKKKKFPVSSFISLLLIIILPVILIIFSFREKKSAFLEEYDGKVTDTNQSKVKKTAGTRQQSSQNSISPENREKSADFTDSADAYTEDYEKAVFFYKLAISFNKYNYRAWYGLVNTYYSMNEIDKAKKTQNEMKKLFGENVFDIGSVIKPFGELESAELRSDSSYYLEYTTNASSQQALVNETFQIIQALKPTCNCISIAIFAQKSPGRGLIVHIKSDKPFFSLTDYKSAASFTYLE